MRHAVAVLLVAAAVATARADATETTALYHLDRGVAAFRAGDYRAAWQAFTAAHELVPDRANPYRWLALTAVQLGDCAAARTNADGFLVRAQPDDPRAAELERVRELCARTGTVAVTTTPAGAAVFLDGVQVGTAPYAAGAVPAGQHVIRAEAPGRTAASRAVLVPAGGAIDVALRLGAPARPLVRRWWLWAAVGTAAVAAAAATIALTAEDDPAALPPIRCDAAGCR